MIWSFGDIFFSVSIMVIVAGFIINIVMTIKAYMHMKGYAKRILQWNIESDAASERSWNQYSEEIKELIDVVYELEHQITELRIQVGFFANSRQESPQIPYKGAKRGPKPRMTLED